MKITKELLLSIILKYFNEKKGLSFYELEKKTDNRADFSGAVQGAAPALLVCLALRGIALSLSTLALPALYIYNFFLP